MSDNKQGTFKDLINSLVSEIEKSDPSMKTHASRVANLCVLFMKDLERPPKEINQLYIAALLHDIGMVFIPKKISSRKTGLNESEMEYIKKHPLISEKILSKYEALKELSPIIRHHHEAIDGSGYPDGLKDENIPTGAKILCIVNSYDSFTTNGLNGIIMNMDDALSEIKKLSGRKFDRALTYRFIQFMRSDEEEKETSQENDRTDTGNNIESEEETTGSVNEIISGIIQKFKKQELNLPVLPEVVKDIQEVINLPSSGIDQLAAVIEKDAVISVRLIYVSNSALYRGTEKILTVKQAIPRIGAKETQSIVATIANKSLYEVKDKLFRKLMEKLWKHSLASAFAAKAISEELRLGESEKYYFMGLIHDIGKVLILKALGDAHQKNESLDFDEMLAGAKAVHTSFGSAILRKWGFSDDYSRICLLHSGAKFKNSTDSEILITNLAGNIAKKAGFSVTSDPDDINIATLDSRILLSIEPPQIDSIIEKVIIQMGETSDIFN